MQPGVTDAHVTDAHETDAHQVLDASWARDAPFASDALGAPEKPSVLMLLMCMMHLWYLMHLREPSCK